MTLSMLPLLLLAMAFLIILQQMLPVVGTLTLDVGALLTKHEEEMRKHRDAADQIVAKVEAENREYTKEEEAGIKEAQDKIVALRKRVELLKSSVEGRKDDAPGSKTRKDVDPEAGAGETTEERTAKAAEARYRKVYTHYLRFGASDLSAEDRQFLNARRAELTTEMRALSGIAGGAGAFTVPVAGMQQIEVSLKDFSGVAKTKSTELSTDTGADMPWPTTNDTSNEGEQVEENQAVSAGDPTFGQLTLKAFLFSSKLLLLPLALVQDTGVDIESLLNRMIGERLGRITNRRFTTGNGANQPLGMVTGSVLGKTAASATAVTFEELIDLQHSVDVAYRNGAEWMFADLTLAAVRKLKDADGRPLWMPAMNSGIAGGAPGLLLDNPYQVNNHMDAMATGKRSFVYGQLSKYIRRRVKGITVLRLAERYAEFMQIGFFGFVRFDGRILDAGTGPIKHLLHP